MVLLPVLLALLIGVGVFLASRDDNRPANLAPATPTTPEPSVISPP